MEGGYLPLVKGNWELVGCLKELTAHNVRILGRNGHELRM